jgi:hypothetical protein
MPTETEEDVKDAPERDGKKAASALPPYLSFKTFSTFLDSLKIVLPTRIDRTVLSSMSGAVQAQLMAALRYLDLVSPNALTKERLANLVNSEGEARKQELGRLLREFYPFLFHDFDLQRATTGQIEAAFRQLGASGETIRKCVAFFLAAAKAADLPVSPLIKTSRLSRTAPTRGIRRSGGVDTSYARIDEAVVPVTRSESPTLPVGSWSQMLLAKFPSFDPAWPDDVKAKWFESFEKLMKSEGKS